MARKKWATTTPTDLVYKRHGSEKAAYEWIKDMAIQYRDGKLRFSWVKVWVDEGRGWELWEQEDLQKLAEVLRVAEVLRAQSTGQETTCNESEVTG